MWYLATKLFWYLLIAFVIGLFVGWYVARKKPARTSNAVR